MVARSQTAAASLVGNSLASTSNAKRRLVVCRAILLASYASPIIIPISPLGFPDAEPLPSLFAEVLLGSISPKLFMCMPPASKM